MSEVFRRPGMADRQPGPAIADLPGSPAQRELAAWTWPRGGAGAHGSDITKEMTKVGSLPGQTVLAHGQPCAEHQHEEHGTACSGVGVWRALAPRSAAGGHGRAQVVAAEN